MNRNRKSLLISLGIPLAVGILGALLSGGTSLPAELIQPPLVPPGWLFPIVWTGLYLLMGYAAWIVQTSGASRERKQRALLLYALQLLANFLWPILFFGVGSLAGSLVCILVLWVLILLTIGAFSQVSPRAGDLLLPFILWVSFATYLNLGFFLLN